MAQLAVFDVHTAVDSAVDVIFRLHIAIELAALAVLLTQSTTESTQLATCVFALLLVCKSIEFVPLLFPQVDKLSAIARVKAPVHFGTIATSAFVVAHDADNAST